jgi:hypothetical protein
VCDSFGGLKKIQNGGRCHGNQGAKNVKKASTHYGKYSYDIS